MKIEVDWQRNFRKIPNSVQNKVKKFKHDDIIVACVKKIPAPDIVAGKYAHIGIKMDGNEVKFEERIMPNQRAGRFSRINIEGVTVVRKDLPMITKTFSIEAPNYGDWSNGSHDVEWDREVYQREFIGPKELELEIELLDRETKDGKRVFVFKFHIDEVLNRTERNFEDDLFSNLNLLQENVGAADVFPATATREDYLKTIFVDWEILPPGKRDDIVSRILSGYRSPTTELQKKLLARYDQLNKLKPIAFINGTSGFQRYFGAKFSDKLVAFENIEYGNAMYVMYDQWEELSKKSRLELLGGSRTGFDRIVHTAGWEEKFSELIRDKRQ
jgi:hypothetical protein